MNVLLAKDMEVEERRKILAEDYEIPMTQEIEKEVDKMCNLGQGIADSAADRTWIKSILNLMDTMQFTMEQAMDALKIPKKDRKRYVRMLKEL